jgi:hypothetical protein
MQRPPVLQTAPRPSRLRVSFVGPTGTPLAAPLGDGAPSLLRAMLLARFRRLLRHRLLWRGRRRRSRGRQPGVAGTSASRYHRPARVNPIGRVRRLADDCCRRNRSRRSVAARRFYRGTLRALHVRVAHARYVTSGPLTGTLTRVPNARLGVIQVPGDPHRVASRSSRASPHEPMTAGSPATGIRRRHGTEVRRKASPLELDPLARLVEPIGTGTRAGLRDPGAAAARVRRRAAALRARRARCRGPHVRRCPRAPGHDPRLEDRDQERAGAQVAVPYARASDRFAVRALQAWLRTAGIHRGPVFRRMR